MVGERSLHVILLAFHAPDRSFAVTDWWLPGKRYKLRGTNRNTCCVFEASEKRETGTPYLSGSNNSGCPEFSGPLKLLSPTPTSR
jgi:hypothetical protein